MKFKWHEDKWLLHGPWFCQRVVDEVATFSIFEVLVKRNNRPLKDKIIYFGKLSASAVFSLVKINVLGFISTGLTVGLVFFIMVYKVNPGQSAHVSALPFLMMAVTGYPLHSLLILFLSFITPYLYVTFSIKYVVTKTAHRLIGDGSEKLIVPLLDRVLAKFGPEGSGLLKKGTDYAKLKLKLIEQVKNDTENKWVRRVIVLGLKQARLDDIEFGNEEQDHQAIIRNKILDAIREVSKPSRKLIWLLLLTQWLIVLFVWLV